MQLHVLSNGVSVEGAELRTIDSAEECIQLVEYSNKRKHIAATAMNAQSSRGHTVFKLVVQHDQNDGVHLTSEVYFADLAGHENERTTKVRGERMVELSFINKSLMWLQSAVHSMSHPPKGTAQVNRMALFRNSKLTLLLSNALLGNSLVHVIVTLSPAPAHFSTSLSSLRFANEVKHITVDVHATAYVDPTESIKRLEAEVRQLKEQLANANIASDPSWTGQSSTTKSVNCSISTADGGAGGAELAAAEAALEDQQCRLAAAEIALEASKADSEKLRREMNILRMELRESQGCVRGLHAELDESRQREQQLLNESGHVSPRCRGNKCDFDQSDGVFMGPEGIKLLMGINRRVDELFRDLSANDHEAMFECNPAVSLQPLASSTVPSSEQLPSPSQSYSSRILPASSRIPSVAHSAIRFSTYPQHVNVVSGSPRTVASTPQVVVYQTANAVQPGTPGPSRGRSPLRVVSPSVTVAPNATPIRRHTLSQMSTPRVSPGYA